VDVSSGGALSGERAHEVLEVEASDLSFPEGPRWHDGRWWLSDQLGGRILTLDEAGAWSLAAVVARPSGLGFTPEGTLWAATMEPPRVVAGVPGSVSPGSVSPGSVSPGSVSPGSVSPGSVSPGSVWPVPLEEVADLGHLATSLNDMVVDDLGRAYVDAYGARSEPGHLVLVTADGGSRVVADDLAFPNGLVVTADGTTLLVAETFAERITAFSIAPDGGLGDRRIWASLPGETPDGICVDTEGALWVSSFRRGEFLRVREGGNVIDRIALGDGRWAMACALGGADGRTLLLCTATTTTRDYFAGRSSGRIGLTQVEVRAAR
jgi:sugar lactone lactonase YvrE